VRWRVNEPNGDSGAADDDWCGNAGVSQFVNPCIAVRLAQLLSVMAADERMMEEHRWLRPAEESRELNLTAG
jgi:hypothetical protein